MNKILLALVATMAATPALAQQAAPFTGGYVAGVVGYDATDLNISGVDNPDGLLYGVQLGYDFQSGDVVFGIEAEATDATTEFKTGGVEIDMARDLYVGGRIGYATGGTLFYGKVGYTNARIESNVGNGDGDGVRFGAGVEYKLAGNLFAKGEYRYSNYEDDLERHQLLTGLGIRF